MNGRDLLEAMSFVEDEYVEEAESEALTKTVREGWRRWVSAAACLCMVIGAAFAYRWADPVVREESMGAEGAVEQKEDVVQGHSDEVLEETQAGSADPWEEAAEESMEVPYVMIQVESQTEDEIVGTVTVVCNLEGIEVGDKVRVPASVTMEQEYDMNLAKSPYGYFVSEDGLMLQITFAAFDTDTTLYVELETPEE